MTVVPQRSEPAEAQGGSPQRQSVKPVASDPVAPTMDATASALAASRDAWARAVALKNDVAHSKLADRLMEKADEVARLETLHNGKPIFDAILHAFFLQD